MSNLSNCLRTFLKTAHHRIEVILKLILLACILQVGVQAQSINYTPLPPYLTETKGAPMVMLNLSRDHQLFYKAYNEYSDLDDDGIIETQYKHSYKYYGYFDNERCYNYNTTDNRYVPIGKVDAAGYCTDATAANRWNGNFMNWATMTRMDVVRRILYGGFRIVDTASAATPSVSLSVIERAHLPTDAHAFAKYYYGTDIDKLTPFSPAATPFTITTATGTATISAGQISLCNASFSNTAAPSILVAEGNFGLWSANERWQCYWSEDKSAANGNSFALTGIGAASSNPTRGSVGLGTGYARGSYTARVEVCKTGLPGGLTADEDSRCKLYPRGNYKPVGLLQKFGERNEAAFGLMTGSFDKNVSGGVLRKNVASFTNEVDIDDGQFKAVTGIVSALNSLRITGYDYGDGTYEGLAGKCNYQQIGLVDGQCRSWGNPLGEMYLESLRYFAGKTADTAFTSSPATSDIAAGLSITTWTDPFAPSTTADFGDRLCRRSSVINFNASVTSFDNDQWSGANNITGLGTTNVDSYTNMIGSAEGLYAVGKLWSIGRNGADNNGFCSDKTITASGATAFSQVTGVCPEAPTQYGGYKMAGAALWAHLNPVRSDITIPASNKRAFKIDTYGVALATGTPRIKIPVPGQAGKFVFISPAYRLDVGGGGGGTLVDFKVVYQTATRGKYVINWEDSEQGGDFDQDVLGTLEYSVNTATSVISVTTFVAAQATANPQGFGYAITGTNGKDGVHFHSGIIGFNYADPRNINVTPAAKVNASGGCSNCQVGDAATTGTYTMAGVTAAELQDPLWYAAKYGGFDRDVTTTYTLGAALPLAAWDAKSQDGSTGADGTPDNLFYAIDPSQLERSLQQVFTSILKAGGAAPAATSARTDAGGYAYQSTHSIKAKVVGNLTDADASGQFQRYSFQTNGLVSTSADWDAGARLTVQNWNTGRKILTLSGTSPTPFRWGNLSTTQQLALRKNQTNATSYDNATKGQNRLDWLRGDESNEVGTTGLRNRPTTKLGAIINSTPWFTGPPSAGYTNSVYGGGYTSFRQQNTATNAVFVAANDGMLHAFNGATGDELFAYVPRAMYRTTTLAPFSKLSALTEKDFQLNLNSDQINMDGSLMAADMKVGGTPTWATLLFGTFGRGGKGVYALDVTSPQTVVETTASAAKLVKWEFSEATGDPDMGFITGRPSSRANGQPFQTGRMANGKWAAIYGNGYNSSSGNATLFILFADGPIASTTTWTTGTHYIKLQTGAAGTGPGNGLSMATALDTDNDGNIDTIYAGDLKGNVWKFDVSSATATNWKVATTGSVPLYEARSVITGTTTIVNQPITTVVQPFPHPNGGFQLVFGTGKSLESNDYPMSAPYVNSIYGIHDRFGNTTTITVGLTDLVAKTTTIGGGSRYIINSKVDYAAKRGWYLNLSYSSEALVFNPLAQDSNRIFLKSIAPDGVSDGCRIDSISPDMTLDVISGSAIGDAVTGATNIPGYAAAGTISSNSFEVGRGGVYRIPTPPASCIVGSPGCSSPVCTAGDPNCVCNPAAASECVYCLDAATCNPPWAPKSANQCAYRQLSALGNGGVETTIRYGSCGDGRLTWREILRNR
jgi:type IV pilus assembly protein PilY1